MKNYEKWAERNRLGRILRSWQFVYSLNNPTFFLISSAWIPGPSSRLTRGRAETKHVKSEIKFCGLSSRFCEFSSAKKIHFTCLLYICGEKKVGLRNVYSFMIFRIRIMLHQKLALSFYNEILERFTKFSKKKNVLPVKISLVSVRSVLHSIWGLKCRGERKNLNIYENSYFM